MCEVVQKHAPNVSRDHLVGSEYDDRGKGSYPERRVLHKAFGLDPVPLVCSDTEKGNPSGFSPCHCDARMRKAARVLMRQADLDVKADKNVRGSFSPAHLQMSSLS